MKSDDLPRLFEEFWYQKPTSLKVCNDSRTLKNFKKTLSKCHSTEDIDNYILESKTRKETMRRIAVEFYRYLRGKGMELTSELEDIRFYDYPFERQLEIAKFLHEPHTNEEIMRKFNIGDERTLRNDLEALRDGIEVMGNTIQIREKKIGRKKYYKSTLHPVFLPLNLTEAYALTVYMPCMMDRADPNADIIRSIAKRIKAQLSDYALERLFPNEREQIDNSKELRYIDDEQLARSRKGIPMYLMKSGAPFSFIIHGDTRKGRISFDTVRQRYIVTCEDGEVLAANSEELEFIPDSVDYR